jgi:hypothetical protein
MDRKLHATLSDCIRSGAQANHSSVNQSWFVSRVFALNFLHLLFEIGHDLRSECRILAGDILPCDRTVKNELERMAKEQRNALKKALVLAAGNYQLSVSPDNWSDNHRKIAYMGATVHFIDDQLTYHSMDLFCSEFVEKKKTAANIYQVRISSSLDNKQLIPVFVTAASYFDCLSM